MGIFARMAQGRQQIRSANKNLYGTRRNFVIPRLDTGSRRNTSISDSVLSNPFLYGPIFQLSFRIGALPIKVYRLTKNPDGGRPSREEASDHPVYQLLIKPNSDMTRNLLISGTVQNMLVSQHAAWLKVRDTPNGPPVELWPLPAQSMYAISDQKNTFLGVQIRLAGQDPQDIPASELCYFRMMTAPDAWQNSASPFTTLGLAADMANSAMTAATELFDMGVLERRYIHSSEEMSEEAFQRLKAEFEQARLDRTQMPFVEGDVEVKSMGGGPEDESMLRAMEQGRKVIYDTLGMPLDGDPQRFYGDAVAPIADSIEQELERSLFPEFENDLAFAQFQFRELLKGTPLQRAQLHQTLIYSGQELIDEARSDEDHAPLPNKAGEKAFVPLNLVDITDTTTNGVPRQKDTAGGFGGNEGKATLPRVGPARMRATQKNWGDFKKKTINGQSEALHRRIKQPLNKELAEITRIATTSPVRAANTPGLPPLEELIAIIRASDPEIAQKLQGFMSNVSATAWKEAETLVSAQKTAVADRLQTAFAERATHAAASFGESRVEEVQGVFNKVLNGELNMRQFSQEVSKIYSGVTNSRVDALSRDSVGYAFEQGSTLSWANAGIRSFDVVFGGGPCKTGVCEEVADTGPYGLGEGLDTVGSTFSDSDTPPLHPYCDCFTVPAVS